ncbi:MAG: NAD(P)/FAD-dependent oxidoreductase [Chloroflexota bacterium]
MAENHQIIVIGAGASGMMAAGRAAEMGAKVLLLEKMERPGKKILITGNGRCNLSNSLDMDSFIAQFGPFGKLRAGSNGHFLYSVFNRFFRDDLLALLGRYGIECKTEPTGKIYPTTDNARDIVHAFRRYLAEGKVTVRFGVSVTGVTVENGRVSGVQTTAGNLPASAVIIAAGGLSHPQTGSTGDGFRIGAALGHTVVKLRPGLVPLVVTDIEQAKEMMGASLRSARVTSFQSQRGEIDPSLVPGVDVGRGMAGKRPKPPNIESRTGDAIVTHFGLSGPVILEMSLAIVDALENGPVSVSIDLMPERDKVTLRTELQEAFDRHSKRTYRNTIRDFLPQKLVEPFVSMTGVPPDKLGNQIAFEERESLLNKLKSLRFDIKGAYSMSTAMVTAGGVSLKEINPHTMASRLVEGLYFCGEVMDLDAGTGGFNLQAAFSTGFVAGENAASFVLTKR